MSPAPPLIDLDDAGQHEAVVHREQSPEVAEVRFDWVGERAPCDLDVGQDDMSRHDDSIDAVGILGSRRTLTMTADPWGGIPPPQWYLVTGANLTLDVDRYCRNVQHHRTEIRQRMNLKCRPSEKKDGSLRYCIDYRGLNAVTQKMNYPLPRIDACHDSLGGNTLFSCLDMGSSY